MTSAAGRLALLERLVNAAGAVRSEATVQSDVRLLLLDAELGLSDVQLETQVGEQHKRIDVEVGCTVIEVKRSLASPAAIETATAQLAGYVVSRQAEMGQRYVGVLTDGRLWVAFHEVDGQLAEVTRHTASAGEAGATALLRWLEGVLATKTAVRPTPVEIHDRLGSESSSHALDFASLAALYADHRARPTVALKRQLWANLLRSALGTQFRDDDELFLEHTLLVNSAEIIAHLVVGLDAAALSPATLLSGDQFTAAGLHGVVDRDFFDWVLEVPGGEGFIAALARRLARFDWGAVDHDVLKVLYESVIRPEVRKLLGEYYTPDWLANRVVTEVVTDPLTQRVLDPSCGSGTFVFYAVRRFLEEADAVGMPLADAMAAVTGHVIGIDLHPVAVALARVTYLLAIGRDRIISAERGPLSVPVYLGDSLGWQQNEDILSVDMLVIPTEMGDQLFSEPLRFPNRLLTDAARFDQIVEALVDESGRAVGTRISTLSAGTIRRLALQPDDLPLLNENFARLKQLHDENRNHIWSYYVRNVSRPAWLSRPENRVDLLVGNPPWLAYRHMTKDMQREFKSMASARGFWHTEKTATHQDLAGLFVARAVERYLRAGGQLAFVVPNSVIDREYWGGFRRGKFDGAAVQFDPPWDLRRVRPHLFPRGSAVVFGQRAASSRKMPAEAVIWKGRAPRRHAALTNASGLSQELGTLTIGSDDDALSPYHSRFAQGATLVPRMLLRVESAAASALGVPAGLRAVKSARSATEKKPWSTLPALTGTVEQQFVYRTYLGEHAVPFRSLEPAEFVLPMTGRGQLLHGGDDSIDAYPGLAGWIRAAESLWAQHSSGNLSLSEQINYMSKLTQQVPVAPIRVVYGKAGMHLTAAVVQNERAVIDHKLYWAAVSTVDEANYLVGVLNAPSLTELVRPLMSYGKDERDIDMAVWRLPIPSFDPGDALHCQIADLAARLTAEVATRPLPSNFVTARKQLRSWLSSSTDGRQLDALVRELLGEPPAEDTAAATTDQPGPGLLRITSTDLTELLAADVEIDLDAEFDQAGPYLWGVLITRKGEPGEYVAFGAPDADPAQLAHDLLRFARQEIATAHDAGRNVHIYHYGSAEPANLNRLLGGGAADLADAGVDMLRLIRDNFFSGDGYSLKTLAGRAEFQWHDLGMTGADTYPLIEAARAGDPDAWEKLLRYNEDDVRALCAVRMWLRATARADSKIKS